MREIPARTQAARSLRQQSPPPAAALGHHLTALHQALPTEDWVALLADLGIDPRTAARWMHLSAMPHPDLPPVWTPCASWRVAHGAYLAESPNLPALAGIPDAVIDAVVTDPPAGIGFMGRAWDTPGAGDIRTQRDAVVAQLTPVMTALRRVLKPGGYALIWALPRTSSWTCRALEDAGFAIRDILHVARTTGWPKIGDVGAQIDAAAGRPRPRPTIGSLRTSHGWRLLEQRPDAVPWRAPSLTPTTPWGAWHAGTSPALKPAVEHWILAQNPIRPIPATQIHAATGWDHWQHQTRITRPTALAHYQAQGFTPDADGIFTLITRRALHAGVATEQVLRHADGETILRTQLYRPWTTTSIAANLLVWGVGALQIGAARIPATGRPQRVITAHGTPHVYGRHLGSGSAVTGTTDLGRWPANLIMQHAPGCRCLGTRRIRSSAPVRGTEPSGLGRAVFGERGRIAHAHHGDPDGTEATEVWDCVPGCPVAAFNALAGESGPTRIDSASPCTSRTWGGTLQANRGPRGYADAGPKSRFFTVLPPDPVIPTARVPRSERVAWCATCGAVVDPSGTDHQAHDLVIHPTQKSVALMTVLIQLVARPGQIILDPYVGTGTTGVAARVLGVRVIGMEQDAASAAVARWRWTAEADDAP